MQPNEESKDIESLRKFWHWSDNENPGRDLFDAKATAGGPLTEEAQEAMQQAVEVIGLRAPNCLHPSGEVLRPAIKLLSFAIMQAWELLSKDERIQQALSEEQTRDSLPPEMKNLLTESFITAQVNDVLAGKSSVKETLSFRNIFCQGDELEVRYPDGTVKKGTLTPSPAGNGTYEFNLVDKAKDIIGERMVTAAKKNRDHLERVLGEEADAVGYTAYNMRIPDDFVQAAVERAKHNIHVGIAVDLKPLGTIIPVIGEMGVTRSHEHDTFRQRVLDMLGPKDLEHLSISVDSRGILFESKEFKDIGMRCGFEEFETCAGNGSIDAHKLFLIVNTMRLDVIKRKEKARGMTVFPDAANMFTGEPARDYAKCEYECNRILNLLGVSDVCVTVDKKDGRVMFYHRIYTGITYTLNYAPTVSSKSVEAAVSTVRKGALAEQERRAF